MEPLGSEIDLALSGTLPGQFADEKQVIWASEYSEDGTGQFNKDVVKVTSSDPSSSTELLNKPMSELALGSYLAVGTRLLSWVFSQYIVFPSATKVFFKESNIASP